MSSMKETYAKEVLPELMKQRGYKNKLEVPRLVKIVISTGIGTSKDKEVFDEGVRTLAAIAGQRPVITKSRKSIANFKLREDMNVGVCVTLRGQRMYDFLYRLINIALPRVRDFRGISRKAFDGAGNYSLGINDQSIFAEVDLDKMKHTIGMNVTIVTTAKTNAEGLELLTLLGMPFVAAQ
jgi:large subunit ribosomal protein L5